MARAQGRKSASHRRRVSAHNTVETQNVAFVIRNYFNDKERVRLPAGRMWSCLTNLVIVLHKYIGDGSVYRQIFSFVPNSNSLYFIFRTVQTYKRIGVVVVVRKREIK